MKRRRARPGFEPGTSRTQSENHAPRPTSLPVGGCNIGDWLFGEQTFAPMTSIEVKNARARPGFEPGTSRTLSENHAPRPTSHAQLDRHSWLSTCAPSCLNVTGRINGQKVSGLVRDLNPGPLAPEARIIPLDQRAIPSSLLQEWNCAGNASMRIRCHACLAFERGAEWRSGSVLGP